MKKLENTKVVFRVFMLCLLFIIIIIYISIQSISSITSANNAFESFYYYQFNSVKYLNRIAKDFLQIRVNMLQEKRAAEKGDFNEIKWRQKYSDRLALDYNNIWKKVKDMNQTEEGRRLANKWLEKSKKTKIIRNKFHKAIKAGNLKKSEFLLAKWLIGYRELRDQTYKLIELQEKIGGEIKDKMAEDGRSAILKLYILLTISIFIGFIITCILAIFFLKSSTQNTNA